GERPVEHLARGEVEVVRRLVQAEERGRPHQHLRERDARLLPAREHRDPLLDGVTREEEGAQDRPQARLAELRRRALELRQHGERRRQRVELVLGVVVDRHVRAERALAAVEREYTREQAEQRRLARAVRSDEGDALATLDLEVDARVDDVVAVRLPRAREPGDAAARPWRGGEDEADVPRLALDLDALEAVEHLDPALDLPRLGRLVAEALDEPLDLGDALGLVPRLGEQELAPCLALDQI